MVDVERNRGLPFYLSALIHNGDHALFFFHGLDVSIGISKGTYPDGLR
jgi:hypothetical protein